MSELRGFRVFAVSIAATDIPRLELFVRDCIKSRSRKYVNVCTAHTMPECHGAPELAAIVSRAALAVPDGMPLVWFGRIKGSDVSRVYGPDIMLELCRAGESRIYRREWPLGYALHGESLGLCRRSLQADSGSFRWKL